MTERCGIAHGTNGLGLDAIRLLPIKGPHLEQAPQYRITDQLWDGVRASLTGIITPYLVVPGANNLRVLDGQEPKEVVVVPLLQ